MILIPALMLMAGTTPQPTNAVIDQPYTAVAGDVQGVTTLTETRDLFATTHGMQHVVLNDFPLNEDMRVILSLDQRQVLADNVELRLNENGTLARPDVVILGGKVVGDQDSTAYLAMSDDMTVGFINTAGEQWIISSGPFGGGNDTVIFNAADLPEGAINWFTYACDALDVPDDARTHDADSNSYSMRGTEPCRVADVAIETDTEFRTALFGGDANAAANYATMLVGAVSEIYERDINTILNIAFLRIWTSADPWNQGDTISQLFQFQDYWDANMTGVQRHTAHFLSGRSLGGGVAYIGGLCVNGFDYALSANLNGFFPYPLTNGSSQNWDIMVTSHEWGHMFGAPHTHEQAPLPNIDNCGNGDCSQLPGTIMSYCHLCGSGVADINLNFHPQNINSWIFAYLNDSGQWAGQGATCDLTGHPLCNAPGCLPDVNGDGILDSTDFTAWIAAFNANDPAADQNLDGVIDPSDFTAWIANFNAGCGG
ncbi:MAG TPA: hypothetical protein ENJ00_10365 [Phycisphaerales bacterium]|nr:hypothetical protein [Phycisphaerales bacterium]